MDVRSTHACFGGQMGFYAHRSEATGTTMRFAVFLPPQAGARRCPALYYLAGLTCTEETFPIKAGAQRSAAEFGLVLVAPDTSPRGLGLPAKPSPGISAKAPGSISTPQRRPGRRTTAWRSTSRGSCQR